MLSRFGLHFQFWKCWSGISNVCFFMMKKALNQTEVLEPQDPKPASRASSGRPTPQLALKFGLGASLKMPNLHPPKRMVYSEAVPRYPYDSRTKKSPSSFQKRCLAEANRLSFIKGTLSTRDPFLVVIFSKTVSLTLNYPVYKPNTST